MFRSSSPWICGVSPMPDLYVQARRHPQNRKYMTRYITWRHWSRASSWRLHFVLIGCSETRTVSARLVLTMRLFTLEFANRKLIQFSSCAVNKPLVSSLHSSSWRERCTGVGTDPAAAGPIIWQTRIVMFALYQLSWTWNELWSFILIVLQAGGAYSAPQTRSLFLRGGRGRRRRREWEGETERQGEREGTGWGEGKG